jgi:predicted dehydrogenase
VGNVARIYTRMANDLKTGTQTAPTFAGAVKVHKIIAAIEQSSESGRRVKID